MATAAQLLLFDVPAQTIASKSALKSVELSPSPTSAACSPRRSQAWLALHFADLALAAAYQGVSPAQRATLDATPWAVVEEDRLKHVVACNERAWQYGVRPGHRMNAAIALCASLTLVARRMRGEKQLLERVATDCLKYTSAVSLQPPNEVLLELRGSFRLFGGPTRLIERIQSDLGALNAGLQLALAPTARSAQWLARASTTPRVCLPRELADTLSTLPVASLAWPLPVELQLARFGITTIGDLMRLSRKDLARRIGAGPVRELQQALGRTSWLHRGWSTPPSYRDRVVLDFEIETTSLLEKMLKRPLARLKRNLIESDRAIDELDLTLKHREGATKLALRLQQATADTDHLAGLLHEHLDRLVLRAPIREVLVDAPRLLVASPHTRSLGMDPATRTDPRSAPELKARLLEQLQSRFGTHAIRALSVRPDHIPERAQRVSSTLQSSRSAQVPAHLPRRPFWLLREPKLATREYEAGEFQIASSPETIEAEAWESGSVRRAYYRARMRDGIECWIFRDLSTRYQWFVHGLFG
ncbi:Y-family DNA polymerase [Peristeroidobacter soli]|uniref:Y-family DNA polymerase n=1 Tax=Peristeroidobacter soli TaxID=2497877 RepID=UPI00101CE656|nr:DNA polymerase Y family protein [Peristeroidobacter soli]